MEPTTGVATQFSVCDNFTGMGKSNGYIYSYIVDSYCGWFEQVSRDGSLVYRLGYQDEIHQQGFGLGILGINKKMAGK